MRWTCLQGCNVCWGVCSFAAHNFYFAVCRWGSFWENDNEPPLARCQLQIPTVNLTDLSWVTHIYIRSYTMLKNRSRNKYLKYETGAESDCICSKNLRHPQNGEEAFLEIHGQVKTLWENSAIVLSLIHISEPTRPY